jgi:hypothetical protein
MRVPQLWHQLGPRRTSLVHRVAQQVSDLLPLGLGMVATRMAMTRYSPDAHDFLAVAPLVAPAKTLHCMPSLLASRERTREGGAPCGCPSRPIGPRILLDRSSGRFYD